MITIGSRKNLLIGGWILAALCLLGYSGLNLMTLLDPKLIGRSAEVRQASQKWQQLSEQQAKVVEVETEGAELNRILYVKPAEIPKPAAMPVPVPETLQPEIQEEIVLPELKGVVQKWDIKGKRRFFAFMGGKLLTANDVVSDFTVEKITEKGVTLSGIGKDWFVPVPEVHFTINQRGQQNSRQSSGGLTFENNEDLHINNGSKADEKSRE